MDSMWFAVTIFITICWSWIQANQVTLDRNMTSWNESHRYCESIGKVLYHVKDSKSKEDLINILNDKEQVWVDATVELSDFVTMPVCLASTGLQSKMVTKFDTDIISNCLKFCKDYSYIGLKDRECHCIVIDKNEIKLLPPTDCKTPCKNNPTHLCGGNIALSLYEKVDTNIIQKIVPGYKECTYAQNKHNATELFTASCVKDTADGVLCETASPDDCRDVPSVSIGSQLCRMDLQSHFRWLQAKDFCANKRGKLMTPSTLPLNLDDSRKYWLGMHRVATLNEKKDDGFIKNYTYCSVAIKEGKQMEIEAEDCQAEHIVVCQDKDVPKTKGSSSENAGRAIIYLVIAGSAILVGVLSITALACILRKRYNNHKTEESATNSSREQDMLQRRNAETEPLRRADINTKPGLNSNENIVPACSLKLAEVKQSGHFKSVEESYDKIEFDKKYRPVNDINADGLHIYDHTVQFMTEDQYDLTHFSGDSNPNPSETYHTTQHSQ